MEIHFSKYNIKITANGEQQMIFDIIRKKKRGTNTGRMG